MKNCPKCNNIHYKLGKYCSRSCANSRIHTEDTKLKIQKSLLGHKISNETKDKISLSLGGKGYRKIKNCIVCGKCTNSITRITCSAECQLLRNKQGASNGGKKSASIRTKRSKDEISLYNLCLQKWPEAKHNFIIAEGWDADIVISEIKVAVLWNGPWHYKDMKIPNHNLKQVQNRDRIKIKLFNELGWKVFSFNDKDYTPQKAFSEMVLVISNDLILEGL
jgi:hypothetical protein